MKTLKFEHINKIYPNNVQAVFDFHLEVEEGEFIVFVGPSGCGKSTILRMVAGLEEITEGKLYIDDKVVNSLAPKDRDISFVFQNYALYGNLTVYDNVGMSLKVAHEDPITIHEKVIPTSKLLGIDEYLNRLPANLSGGQKQRVALGRAITRTPKVFLMDEPLSNLDAKLRNQSRIEILKLQRSLGITTIYVTHDQVEAMAMATRIVVLKDGYIQQIGTPQEVYNTPNNIFVAGFIGSPRINLISGNIENGYFVTEKNKFKLTDAQSELLKDKKEVILGIRPESVIISETESENAIKLPIDHVEFCGDHSTVTFNLEGINIISLVRRFVDEKEGNENVFFDIEAAHFFDVETKKAIR